MLKINANQQHKRWFVEWVGGSVICCNSCWW